MQITKRIFLSLNIAGSSKGSVFEEWELEQKERPRFGRNWWFWTPSIANNKGGFKGKYNTYISITWLCFIASITVYANKLGKQK